MECDSTIAYNSTSYGMSWSLKLLLQILTCTIYMEVLTRAGVYLLGMPSMSMTSIIGCIAFKSKPEPVCLFPQKFIFVLSIIVHQLVDWLCSTMFVCYTPTHCWRFPRKKWYFKEIPKKDTTIAIQYPLMVTHDHCKQTLYVLCIYQYFFILKSLPTMGYSAIIGPMNLRLL